MSSILQRRQSKARPTVPERIDFLVALHTEDKAELASRLRPFLRDRSSRVRSVAIQWVVKHDLRKLEHEISSLLSDKSSLIRDQAIECLGNFYQGTKIMATWLYPFLHDNDWLVRVETLESLDQIGDKSSLPLISEKLNDEHPTVRSYAATAIADLGGKRYLAKLRHHLENEEADRAKVGLAYALFTLGDASQFPLLIELLSSSDYTTRCASANSIADLDLTPQQLQMAFTAVSHAAKKFLYRGDQSTMETVGKQLLESFEGPRH
jgi:HEAT repeat protein